MLFDEIEKASPALWQLLLGILDKATLTLGDNRTVDFSRTIICMTSNLGTQRVNPMPSSGIGFVPPKTRLGTSGKRSDLVDRDTLEAVKQHFSPEFINRLDKVVVFQSLSSTHLEEILQIELDALQARLFAAGGQPSTLRYTHRAKSFLLREGTDAAYGARHLKRAIEQHLVCPLSNLIATGQTDGASLIEVDARPRGKRLVFSAIAAGFWPEISPGEAASLEREYSNPG